MAAKSRQRRANAMPHSSSLPEILPAAGASQAGTRERLLAVAARLFATRGFNEVGIMEIGGELGLTGAALYRHFDSKMHLLSEMCDRVISRVTDEALAVGKKGLPDEHFLAYLIEAQIDLVMRHRDVVTSYNRHMSILPPENLRRFRRLQRIYMEEWVNVLAGLRPDLDEKQGRALAHAVIGVIHSAVMFDSALSQRAHAELLRDTAYRALNLSRPEKHPTQELRAAN